MGKLLPRESSKLKKLVQRSVRSITVKILTLTGFQLGGLSSGRVYATRSRQRKQEVLYSHF